MNRRYFLMTSAAGLGALARSRAQAGANDRIRVACVGVRSRGVAHMEAYPKIPNVEVAALCDVDQSVLNERLADMEKLTGHRPAGFSDFRKLLEDKSIDAVSIATPNHWHTLQTIWACQAGKDVYVEKPGTHNMFEARQIVAAARRYNRIVQHGTQSRSLPAFREAAQKLSEGVIGDVYLARGLCFKWRDTIGHTPEAPVPAGVDYDQWLGPAPKHAFTKNRFHYNWHWFWDYGNGDIGNQGAHQIDIARWMLGVRYPTRVTAMGGHYLFDDDQETPNTLNASFEFDNHGKRQMLEFEVRPWMSNHEAGIGEGEKQLDLQGKPVKADDVNTIGNIFYGSKGYMVVGDGYKTYLGKTREPGPSSSAMDGDHFANFIDAMRSRRSADLRAGIEEGAASTVLIHLANIAYKVGRVLNFDSASMTCRGDAEANALFTRAYRAPYVVPKIG